jgi:hypothetical protein
MFAALAGLAAGFFHVLAGPDHLAAVTPLAVGSERAAWRSGLTWGVGHTAGVVVVGLLLLAFRELLPVEALSAFSERLVGVALIGLGGWGVWRARFSVVHVHPGGTASFGMGTVHGLAGSSHLFGVLPTLAFATRVEAGWYLAGFGIGAVAAMTAFAAVIGAVAIVSGHSSGAVRRTLLYSSSVVAVIVGGTWLLT